MWNRFTEPLRCVVYFAQDEAEKLGTNQVSTEHLSLGILRDDGCNAARLLGRLGISLPVVRHNVERLVEKGDGTVIGDMQLAPDSKRAFDLACDEARQMGENVMGTEHLLVGLIREEEGIGGRVLLSLGLNLESLRAEIGVIRNLKDWE